MGITTASAFLTTVSASLVLATFTHVTIFSKFGVFLVTCMVFSIIVTETWFHAALAIFGPEDFSTPVGEGLLRKLRGQQPDEGNDMTGDGVPAEDSVSPLSDATPAVKVDVQPLKPVLAAAGLLLVALVAVFAAGGEETAAPGSRYSASSVCENICMSGYRIRGGCVPVGHSPLQYYVELEDPAYSWTPTGQTFQVTTDLYGNPLPHAVMVEVLNMTSQSWLTPEDSSQPFWWHLVVVMVPENLDTSLDTAFLYITGGSNGDSSQRMDTEDDELVLMATMAQQTATVTVLLKHVPNERISFQSDHSGAETRLFEPFYAKNHFFTKTGSGQT